MRTNSFALAGLTALLTSLGGCTSTFKGEWIDPQPPQAGKGRETGIPVVMSRPVFSMDISGEDAIDVKTNKKNYKVSVEWVPDSEARYSLTLDPALWVESAFSTSFDSNGFLSGGTGKLTSQVVANIQTLGGLAATLAKAGVFDEQSALGEIESAFSHEKVKDSSQCKEKSLWPYDKAVETPDGSTANFDRVETVLDSIKNRWQSYIPTGAKPEEKYKRLVQQIHYGNERELACFKVLQGEFNKSSATSEKAKEARDKFEKEAKLFQKGIKSKNSLARLKKIVDAVNATNLGLLERLMNEFREAAEKTPPEIDGTEMDQLSELYNNGKIYSSYISKTQQAYELLDQIVRMEANTLRARRSQELQDRIKRFTSDADRFWVEIERRSRIEYVNRLSDELHRLTDTVLLAKQIKNLEKFLEMELKQLKSPNGGRFPMEEHLQAKEQLAKLQVEMQTRINTSSQLGSLNLSSVNDQFIPISIDTVDMPDCVNALLKKSDKVPDDVKGYILTRATPEFVDQFNNEKMAQAQCAGVDEMPEYVIVLRPVQSKPLARVNQTADTQFNPAGDNR